MNESIRFSEMSVDELKKLYDECKDRYDSTAEEYRSKIKSHTENNKLLTDLKRKEPSVADRFKQLYENALEKTQKESDTSEAELKKLKSEYDKAWKQFWNIAEELDRRGIIIGKEGITTTARGER